LKTAVSGIVLALLLMSLFTGSLEFQLGRAEPSTIIVPDKYPTIQGAIDHAVEGDTIFVRRGKYHESIMVYEKVSIIGEDESLTIIDGDIMITADGAGLSNFTIQNGERGVYLTDGSNRNSITTNTIKNDSIVGIQLGMYQGGSSNNVISGNNISECGEGIHLIGSNNNIVSSNNVSNNFVGIQIDGSCNNTLTGNSASNNTINFGLFGLDASLYNDIDRSNLVDNKPIYYLENVTDTVYDSSTNAGTVYLINCANVTLKDLTLTRNFYGIFLWNTSCTIIENVTAWDNYYCGLWFEYQCDNEVIANNTFSSNGEAGMSIITNNSVVSGNQFLNSSLYGMHIVSFNTTISANVLSGNAYAICAGGSDNKFTDNNITSNACEILQAQGYNCCNNSIYHNNFINNQFQTEMSAQSVNYWDNGYPWGGNYWSDYNVEDLHSGIYQNETGSDGIGDMPKIIDANNTDKYPLMKPYAGPHDIGITVLNPSKTVMGKGCCMNVDFEVINYGEGPESFGTTLLANSTMIETQKVTLPMRNSTNIVNTWNTTEYALGNYVITASVGPVPNEIDIADNNRTVWVTVTIPGDINGDFKVNLADLVLLAQAYGSHPGDAKWNYNADIIGHGTVDLSDLVTLAIHYGQHYP
jgi:parallel beta-helix repeat protein